MTCRPSRLLVLTAAGFLASGCWIEIEEDENDVQSSVQSMLSESAAAWNRGELDHFMDDYLQSDAITYIGSTGLITGYDAIRERYAPLFEPKAARDSLRFESIAARRLDGVHGLVTARWILHRGGETTASGSLTSIVRRTSSGWKIIHDHSSSDPQPAPLGE